MLFKFQVNIFKTIKFARIYFVVGKNILKWFNKLFLFKLKSSYYNIRTAKMV